MIDEISAGVKRLNEMAHSIQDELQEHDRLIDGVEIEVEVAQTRLEKNKKEIERVLQTNSTFVMHCFIRLVPDKINPPSLLYSCILWFFSHFLFICLLTHNFKETRKTKSNELIPVIYFTI